MIQKNEFKRQKKQREYNDNNIKMWNEYPLAHPKSPQNFLPFDMKNAMSVTWLLR